MPNPLLEVDKFKAWAGTYPSTERYGEWECDYTEWPALHAAVLEFVASRPFDHWQREEQVQVLYAIARDNEIEYLAEEIRTRHPELLPSLAQASLEIDESDARWQLAVQLAWLGAQAEPLLLKMADDEHESSAVQYRSPGLCIRLASDRSRRPSQCIHQWLFPWPPPVVDYD
jgi:hypothetical protein